MSRPDQTTPSPRRPRRPRHTVRDPAAATESGIAPDGATADPLASRVEDGVRRGPYETAYSVSRGYEADRVIIRP